MAAADHAYWDQVAAQEDKLPDGWRRHARDEHLRLFSSWVPVPRGRWLKTDLYEERDARRSLLPHLAGPDWIGTDLAPEVVRRGGTGAGVAADVRHLPFADASFDGVLSTSTLDHFEDPADIGRSLVELRRLLRVGGDLVLTLDNARNPLIRTRNALPRGVARRTGLVPFAVGATLDEAGGREALTAAGFEVLAVEHLLHAPHVVGTRPAAWTWWEERVLPGTTRLGRTRLAAWTGHFVAFHARATRGH